MRKMRVREVAGRKAMGLVEAAYSIRRQPQTTDSPSLGVVLAGWDPDATIRALRLLTTHLNKAGKLRWSIVVVANRAIVMQRLYQELSDRVTAILGSNSEAEFSAYEEGRHYLADRRGCPPATWLIVNDRLPDYDVAQLRYVTPDLLRLVAALDIASGQVTALHRPIDLWGTSLSCFLGTYWLLTSESALQRVGSICSLTSDRYEAHAPSLFPGHWPFSQWLGPSLSDYIAAFVTQPGQWSRAEPLTAASWGTLRFKTLCILNEKLLSTRLLSTGVPLIPWRQTRLMSQSDPATSFARHWHDMYIRYVDIGPGIEMSTAARRHLLAAIVAATRGSSERAIRLLQSTAHVANAALARWRSGLG